MDTLRDTLRHAISEYAVNGDNFDSVLTVSSDELTYTVVDFVNHKQRGRSVMTSIVARLIGDKIVIEQDDNDKPLVDALMQAGIPRRQIVLAYAGEPVPKTGAA